MRRSPFLPTPALLPGRKVRLAHSPHFSAFQQPYGLEHNRYVPPAMPAARGSLVKSNVVDNANVAVPVGALRSPPSESRTHETVRRLPGIQPSPGHMIRLLICSRGTPEPGSPGPHTSSFRSEILSIKCAANPSPIAGTKKCGDIFRASPSAPRDCGGRSALTVRIPAKRRNPIQFGRSCKKQRSRITHTGFERVGPCPGTWEIRTV